MLRLILLVSVTLIYTMSLLLANHTRDYYFIFNICVVAIVVSSYYSSSAFTLLLMLFCCTLSFVLTYGGAPLAQAMQSIILFCVCVFLTIQTKRIFNKLKEHKQSSIKSLEEKLASSESVASQLSSTKAQLENKVSKISDLYYSVKKMGRCFAFDVLLSALRDTIMDSFKLGKCELLTLYHSDGTFKVDKIYQITKDKIEQAEGFGYEEGLLKFTLRKRQLLKIDAKKGKIDAEEFAFPENLNTFLAAPIISADKTNAILVAEDIELEQSDQFAVVANQFSMALERIRLYELMQELAITDGLTNVFVRRHMLERLNEELMRAEHFNSRVSLLMLDIDDFKNYNDRYGHLKGDLLLKKTATVLKNGIREIDIIGRYGGEEFCIILPDTDKKGAELLANRLRENVASEGTTISVGVAAYPENAKTSSNLIEKADKMLYKAKQTGKNRVCVYAD